MKTYHGMRTQHGVVVMVVDPDVAPGHYALKPDASLAIRNHSPDGFEWGYGGSGPAQLSLAILLDYFGGLALEKRGTLITARAFAERNYQSFKRDVVAAMPRHGWELTGQEIERWGESAFDGKTHLRAKWDGGPEESAESIKAEQDEFRRKFNQGGWGAV